MKPCYEIFLNGSSVISFNALYGNFLQLFNHFDMKMVLGIGTSQQPFSIELDSVFFDQQSMFPVKSGTDIKTVWECSFPVHRGSPITIRGIRLGYLDGENFLDVSETLLDQPITIYDGDLVTIRYSLISGLINQTIANVSLVPLQNANSNLFYYLYGPLPSITDGQLYDVMDYEHESVSANSQMFSSTGSFEENEILANGPQLAEASHGLYWTGYGGLYIEFASAVQINQTITFSYTVGGQT